MGACLSAVNERKHHRQTSSPQGHAHDERPLSLRQIISMTQQQLDSASSTETLTP